MQHRFDCLRAPLASIGVMLHVQAVQPLVRILLSQQGRRTIPESISGPSLASAMMVLRWLHDVTRMQNLFECL